MKIWITILLTSVSLSATIEDKIPLFSPKAVDAAGKELAKIKEKTGKEILIITLPELGGKQITILARDTAIQRKLNGAVIVISKSPRQLDLIMGRKTSMILTNEHRKKIMDIMSKGLKISPDNTLNEVTKYLSQIFLSADKSLIEPDLHDIPVEPTTEPRKNWLKALMLAGAIIVAAAVGLFVYRRKAISTP